MEHKKKTSTKAWIKPLLSSLFTMIFCVVYAQSGNIPVIHITTTSDEQTITRSWLPHTKITITLPDGKTILQDEMDLKGFGNSSFNKPKKPLTFRFTHDVSLLGMTPNKKWYLVSNFMDHSLLRNALALSVAHQTSMPWNSSWRMAEVVKNGVLQGCYLIGEEIHVGKDWVDADPQTGFLAELDTYPGKDPRFLTPIRHLPVNIRYPQTVDSIQLAKIQNIFGQVEKLLYRNEPTDFSLLYSKYLDLDSYVDWWLIHELCQNAEPNGPRSCYMYLGRDGKLHAGPVWDFDLAFIDVDVDRNNDIRPARFHLTDVRHLTVDSIYNGKALWYDRLLQDVTFRKRVSEHWATYEPSFRALADSLDHWWKAIEPSAVTDQRLWGAKDPAKFDTCTTFASSAAHLRTTYLRRIKVLHNIFAKWQ
jgi:hypothetical protein